MKIEVYWRFSESTGLHVRVVGHGWSFTEDTPAVGMALMHGIERWPLWYFVMNAISQAVAELRRR